MAWFKADDRLLGHWKFLGIDNDTLGTWFRCGVWSAQQVTDGFVPDVVLEAFTTPEVVDNLIRRGLWTAEDGGIRFHDWAEYQITKSEQDGKRQAERDRKRRQRRGSNGKYVADDEVPDGWDEFVGPEETDVPPLSHRDMSGQAASPSGTERPSESVRRTRPDPTRTEPNQVSPNGETRRESHPPVEAPSRDDVERVCRHMADSVEARGAKRPTITKAWRDAARLLLDKDGHTEADAIAAIDWSANNQFWQSVILTPKALRKHYDQMLIQSRQPQRRTQADLLHDMVQRNTPTNTDTSPVALIERQAS